LCKKLKLLKLYSRIKLLDQLSNPVLFNLFVKVVHYLASKNVRNLNSKKQIVANTVKAAI